jgi:hypothetical protein
VSGREGWAYRAPEVPARHAEAWAEVRAEFGGRWELRVVTGGMFVATIKNHGGHTPIPQSAATPAELAALLRLLEARR